VNAADMVLVTVTGVKLDFCAYAFPRDCLDVARALVALRPANRPITVGLSVVDSYHCSSWYFMRLPKLKGASR